MSNGGLRALLLAFCLGGLAVGGLAGCSTIDHVTLTGSPYLNRCSESSDPHQVVVRIYYLKNTDRFLTGDFRTLWDSDREVLQDDYLGHVERKVLPRGQVEVRIERKDAAKEAVAIGVLADFCRTRDTCWREAVLLGSGGVKLSVILAEQCLTID